MWLRPLDRVSMPSWAPRRSWRHPRREGRPSSGRAPWASSPRDRRAQKTRATTQAWRQRRRRTDRQGPGPFAEPEATWDPLAGRVRRAWKIHPVSDRGFSASRRKAAAHNPGTTGDGLSDIRLNQAHDQESPSWVRNARLGRAAARPHIGAPPFKRSSDLRRGFPLFAPVLMPARSKRLPPRFGCGTQAA